MDSATRDQNLDEAVCISHGANSFRKSIIQLFPLQLSPLDEPTGIFNLDTATSLREGNL